MPISKDEILQEVKRIAEKNGGKPLGRLAFFNVTGIKETDWRGRFWARWNDVLREAGYGPNTLVEARPEATLLDSFANLALELRKIPVYSELRLKKRTDPEFPNDKTFTRLGNKAQLLAKLHHHCSINSQYATLIPLIEAALDQGDDTATATSETESTDGFVYLVKMGKHYKIGRTFSVPRRHRELSLEMPEKLKPVHVIRTDDPMGIEAYWHKRFQAKCTNSEWFALSPEDIRIFKKRKFM